MATGTNMTLPIGTQTENDGSKLTLITTGAEDTRSLMLTVRSVRSNIKLTKMDSEPLFGRTSPAPNPEKLEEPYSQTTSTISSKALVASCKILDTYKSKRLAYKCSLPSDTCYILELLNVECIYLDFLQVKLYRNLIYLFVRL